MKARRYIIVAISIIMTLMISAHAQGGQIKFFSDVPENNWAHAAIMDMVDRGMFNGTTVPVNGVGTFDPERTMTRVQFIVALTRYLYPDELASMETAPGAPWYANGYQLALKYGLVLRGEFSDDALHEGCSRQEMAMLMVRAAKLGTGETPKELVPVSRIADHASVGDYYKDYVRQAYSLGLLTGVDNIGTFLPDGVLNRAQAATVVYRLLKPETRSKVSFSEQIVFTWPTGITYEGECKNGEANGFGKMTFPGVGYYEGYFVDGKRQGTGTFTWDVGDVYVGNWENDAMNGSGTYTFADGYVIRGTWEDNSIKVRNFSLSKSSVELVAGTSTQIVALCEPQYITDVITWKSSNENIATVSSEDNLCTISAKTAGTTKVTATTASGKVCTCTVTVKKAVVEVSQIALNYGDYSLNVGKQVILTATISPENTTQKKITWVSSDPTIANVSSTGIVTAYSEGVAIISASAENGVVATCYVTVQEPAADLLEGTWLAYEADSSCNPIYQYYSSYTCVFDAEKMTVQLSGYPFYDTYVPLEQTNEYTWCGTCDSSIYTYDLTFTSISENQIILEENEIYDGTYYDNVYTTYYVLYRQ